MKKITVILLALAMMLGICACGQKTETVQIEQKTEQVGMPNPWVDYASLQELNEAFGTKLVHPPVMGVTDEHFSACDMGAYTIAQYQFDLNGVDYCFRCAPTTEDISGFYIDGKTAFEGKDSPDEYVFTGDAKLARWFYTDGQYCLVCKDDGVMDEETFKMIIDELKNLTFPGMTESEKAVRYSEMTGSYQDGWSQRACAEVTGGNDAVSIEISWSSSAFESNIWTMTARFSEDGLLSYSDCREVVQTCDQNGQITEEVIEDNASGFFSVGEDGKIYWNGAQDENCRNCVFEKIA